MLQNAMNCLEHGKFRQAEAICREVLSNAADDEGARILLAICLQAQGRVTEALPWLEELTQRSPSVFEHWNNYGTALRALRRYPEAERAYERALAISGANAGVLLNLGLNSLDKTDPQTARDYLLKALALAPDDAEIRTYCASAVYDCGDTRTARELIANWQEWVDTDPNVLAEAAWLMFRSGSAAAGLEALEIALHRHPSHVRLQVRQAAMYERSNRLDEAQALVDSLSRHSDMAEALVEDLALVRASLAARTSDLDGARRMHEKLLAENVGSQHNTPLYFSLAKICDRLGDPAAAMQALANGHSLQIEAARKISPKHFREGKPPLNITRFRLAAADVQVWAADPAAPDSADSPIFVVGFPRSGTTMLETMLDAHPQLACMDERPFLQDLVEVMGTFGLRYPDQLGQLSPEQMKSMRDFYWKRVASCVQLGAGTRLVAKNPMNLLRLPMIRRLFPNSRLVLTLRDPADVVLSNYLQSFRSPVFVAMCASLQTTAAGYADAMDFWLDQSEVLQPEFLELRYEDLVADLETHARRLIGFLGLPWDAGLLTFHEHAQKRGYISTPSYSQVVQPVYAHSVGRWRAYADYFESVKPLLAPFAQRWGYSAT